MKLMATAIPFVLLLLIRIPCFSQKVSIQGSFTLSQIFEIINKKTGYDIARSPELLKDTSKITLNFRNDSLNAILKACFRGMRVDYEIRKSKMQIIINTRQERDTSLYYPIEGKVLSIDSQPLAGATLTIWRNNTKKEISTNAEGAFHIKGMGRRISVTISYTGYYQRHLILENTEYYNIQLEPSITDMNAAIVQLYGMTTPRLATGAETRVQGSVLERQPVSNLFEALEGRVPGLAIRQYNGITGSSYEVLIRGLSSIAQGRDPLILLDGVPIAGYNSYLSTIGSGSAQGNMGASVLNSIPLSSIASIDVLKDAAATAIYGSRGANGVILITLKQAATGKLKYTIDSYSGYTRSLNTGPLLNTQQYLNLRRDAILNDGLPVNSITLPELSWDSSNNTNFKKLATGHQGILRDIRASITGGDSNTSFLLTGDYHFESAALPGRTGDKRLSVYSYLQHQSKNRQWQFHLSGLYNWEYVDLPQLDPSTFMLTAPNAPNESDNGRFVWQQNGLSFINILAQQLNNYHADIKNYFNHLECSYTPSLRGLLLKGSLGYNTVTSDERVRQPLEAQDPAIDPVGHASLFQNKYSSTIAEFTPEYSCKIGESMLEGLLGVTWQQESKSLFSLVADGYPSDIMLDRGSGAQNISTSENKVDYRYEALFGRINYNFQKKYMVTLSGRRDGSSRFGPGNQFGNFWALGTAWIFTDEPLFKQHFKWLHFGKLRSSYGTTGNDQIGDNVYAQMYRSTTAARGYQGQQGINPVSFYNGELGWEVNHKTELATDLGFCSNRLVFSAAYYRNWTDNQLLYQALSSQSGLPGVITNQKATLLNTGLEFMLRINVGDSNSLHWSSTFSLTSQKNKLQSFKGLANYTYGSSSLVIGQSLNVFKGYHFTGVDRQTGLNTFKDVNNDGILDKQDWVVGGSLDLSCFAGWENNFRYKGLELSFTLEARKQKAPNPVLAYYTQNPPGMAAPGMQGNVPAGFLDRIWHQPGDQKDLQRLTATPGSAAANTLPYYLASDAWVTDGSFIRFKSLSFSYTLPENWFLKNHLTESRIFLRGYNLLTLTHYHYADPETQDPNVLPPTRNWVAGIQLTFK